MTDNSLDLLIGQRVVVNDKWIGVVMQGEYMEWGGVPGVWVLHPNGRQSCYDRRNIKPLPGGQL